MTQLFSYKGAFPYPLPQDMSKYNLNDFYPAPEVPALTAGQVLEWELPEWKVRDSNASELEIQWTAVRKLRDSLLATSDIFVIRAYENSVPVPVEVVTYRQALRDVTTQPNPFNIDWPVLQKQ